MNIRVKPIYIIAMLAASWSCTKTAEIVDPEGLPVSQVYIPGANEIFKVPGNNAIGSFSFDNESMKIEVSLGVGRSGTSKRAPFMVSLTTDKDTVSKLIETLGGAYVQFPDDMIALPDQVEVKDGEAGAEFLVELDLARASEYVGKTLVLAVKLENPTKYSLSASGATKIIYFNYLELLGLPTFVDEFGSRDYTSTYANITGTPSFETVGDPQNYYNDKDRLLRSSDEAVHVIYDVAKMKNLLPFASGFTGFKINALAPGISIFSMMKIAYSVDNAQSFMEVSDITVDAVNIPEMGNNAWIDYYLQAPLPTGTTHISIELLNQAGTGLPPWNPLLRRVELFYQGGTSYVFQKP